MTGPDEDVERDWETDPHLSALDRQFSAIGRELIEAVGLPPAAGETPFSIGVVFDGVIRNVESERRRREASPTKSPALNAANHAAEAIEQAIAAIRKFDALWRDPETGSPWVRSGFADHWSHEVALREMQRTVDHFRNEIPNELDDFARGRIANVETVKFLAMVFERMFGEKPDGTDEGPFIRFFNFVNQRARLAIDAGSAARYLRK